MNIGSQRKYRGIKAIIPQNLQEQIESLAEGKSLFVEVTSDFNIKTFQNKVYAFLHQSGIKPLFRIYVEEKVLRIRRLRGESICNILTQEQPLTSAENFVADQMFDIENETEAMDRISLGVKNKELNDSDIIFVFQEWKRAIKGESVESSTPSPNQEEKTSAWDQLKKTHDEDSDKLKKEN